jgi:octaprenyl-diphosphate synthase
MEKSSLALSQIFDPIRADLAQVDAEFGRHIESQIDLIPKIGKYIQTSGGKRMRPAVLLMSARLSGYTGDRAILYAAVVEFIHTATLVHDDIIDDADLRRGRLAVHSRWGNDITVLLGDYLYIKSMALALTHDTLDIVRLLCEVTLRMIEGELYQLTKNGDADITEDEHFDIIRRKTAYLFGGCAEIGGMLGKVGPERETALREYGFNLGIAFQIHRRSAGRDRRRRRARQAGGQRPARRKMTLPLIHLLQQNEEVGARNRCATSSAAGRSPRSSGKSCSARSGSTARSSTRIAVPPSSPSGRRSRCTRFRPARSGKRCSRCPTTSCRGTVDRNATTKPRRHGRELNPVRVSDVVAKVFSIDSMPTAKPGTTADHVFGFSWTASACRVDDGPEAPRTAPQRAS